MTIIVNSSNILLFLGEGESVFHLSIHDRYEARPVNSDEDEVDWDMMSLADFASNYDIIYNPGKRKNVIKLQSKKGYIVKRGSPAVIRYFMRYTIDEDMYRGLCTLFLPFRNELQDIHYKDVNVLYVENQELIEKNRQKYEKHRGMVEIIKKIEESRELDENDDLENEEKEFDEYIEDETTDPSDIAAFEKEAKDKAMKALSLHNLGIEILPDDTYLNRIKSLNHEQQRIFHDFCERMTDRTDSEPFYTYISGEAGTGKSFLMNLMIEFMKRSAKQSGTELHKPLYLTVAPTGVSAWIIGGDTIESGLSLQPSNRPTHLKASASSKANLQFMFEHLQVVFLDEVSMVGTNKFKEMDFRLQDIMMNNKFMGGVSMVICGDFGQLPPVRQSMIWGHCNLDGRPEIATNEWNQYVKIYNLQEKMRSQDPEYSQICDKVRLGICDSNIIKYMESHVTTSPNQNNNENYARGKLLIIVTTNADKTRINTDLLNSLLPNEKSFVVSSVDKATNINNPPPLDSKLPMTQTGQLESQVVLKKGMYLYFPLFYVCLYLDIVGAPVMLTSNSSVKKYKLNGVCIKFFFIYFCYNYIYCF